MATPSTVRADEQLRGDPWALQINLPAETTGSAPLDWSGSTLTVESDGQSAYPITIDQSHLGDEQPFAVLHLTGEATAAISGTSVTWLLSESPLIGRGILRSSIVFTRRLGSSGDGDPGMTVVDVVVDDALHVVSVSVGDPAGPPGPRGADGEGVPAGGQLHQVLRKASTDDYDTEWAAETRGGANLPADATGWLHDDGTGALSWSTPTAAQVGAATPSAVSTAVAGETDRATATEAVIATGLAAETTRAEAAESALSTTLAGKAATSALAAEVTRATAAEGTNADAVAAEVTRAEGAEATLTSAITAEATARSNADAAEVIARNAAIATAVAGVLGGAPGALDTLKELADAINDDASFAASVTTTLAGKQPIDADLTAIAALSTTAFGRAFLTMADAAATKTALALVKGDVGLGSVDNTSDAGKPVSTAQQTALDGKQPLDSDLTTIAALDASSAGAMATDGSGWVRKTYAQLKTALSLVKADVGLGNVDNTSDASKPVSTAQATANTAVQTAAATDATTKVAAEATARTAAIAAQHTADNAAYGPYGLAIGRGACVVPVGSANLVGNFASTGTETAASYRSFFPISDPTCVEVLPVFSNQPNNTGQVGDQRAPNDITIAAAIELSDGTVVPFTFNGQHTVTIPRGGGLAIPDHPLNIGVQVTDGNWGVGGVYIRTYVSVAASRIDTAGTTSGSSTITDASVVATDQGRPVTGTGIPVLSFVGAVTPGTSFTLVNILGTAVNATVTNASASLSILSLWPLNQSTLSTGVKKVATTDLTLEGSTAGSAGFGGSNSNSYGPAFILGKVPATRKPLIASITDSIFHGTTDQQTGPVQRAAATLGLPHVKMSKVSETAAALTTPAGRKYRAHLLQGATHGVIELGTNDGIDTVPKATTLQTNLTTLLTYLNSLGGKWWVTTVPPKGASSTDGYATTGGQTPNSLAAAQAQINTWIRGGCSGLAAGFIELADVVCSARDSGLWAQHPTRGRHLTDLATTSGSNVVTSASAAFTSADIGLGIFVTGVYTNVTAVISTIVDAQTVTVTNTFVGGSALNAGSTVSGAVGGVGAWYATADGTHPSAAMMIGGVLTNVSAALSAMTL